MDDEEKKRIKTLAEQLKTMNEMNKEQAELAKKIQTQEENLAKLMNPVFSLSGFVAAYMNFVKKTDGVISVMPSCLKAIQTAEKSATVETVNAAMKAIADQQKAAIKEAGSDAGKKKAATEFGKNLAIMSDKLEALL